MDEKYAQYLINKTFSDYNAIAQQFSSTRAYNWKDLGYLKKFCSNGDKVLDLGCGSGRLISLLKEKQIKYTGIDSSSDLIKIAKEKYPNFNFQLGNALNLCFKSNSF
ncbi:unnamed protein product, partial [marine sediment metagenome]